MRPLYTLVAVGLAFAVPFTELAPLYGRMVDEIRCPKQCYAVVVPQERPQFHVGSHGQGPGFIQQGPIRVITPA